MSAKPYARKEEIPGALGKSTEMRAGEGDAESVDGRTATEGSAERKGADSVRHTPGPWTTCGARNDRCQCGMVWDASEEICVASAYSTDNTRGDDYPPSDVTVSHEEMCANARLIAAAPELLTALKASRCEHCGYGLSAPREGVGCVVCRGRVFVIAKAEGSSA